MPLDTALMLEKRGAGYAMLAGGGLVMEARAASVADLADAPLAPSLEEAPPTPGLRLSTIRLRNLFLLLDPP